MSMKGFFVSRPEFLARNACFACFALILMVSSQIIQVTSYTEENESALEFDRGTVGEESKFKVFPDFSSEEQLPEENLQSFYKALRVNWENSNYEYNDNKEANFEKPRRRKRWDDFIFPSDYEDTDYYEDKADESFNKQSPPFLQSRNIITAPSSCPRGTRMDAKGRCKTIIIGYNA